MHQFATNKFAADISVNGAFDGSAGTGRKGIAYDWQSLYAAAEAESLDVELAALLSQFAG